MKEPAQKRGLGVKISRLFKRIFGTVFSGFGLFFAVACFFGKTKPDADPTIGYCFIFLAVGLLFFGMGVHVILFPDKWHVGGEVGGHGD